MVCGKADFLLVQHKPDAHVQKWKQNHLARETIKIKQTRQEQTLFLKGKKMKQKQSKQKVQELHIPNKENWYCFPNSPPSPGSPRPVVLQARNHAE